MNHNKSPKNFEDDEQRRHQEVVKMDLDLDPAT